MFFFRFKNFFKFFGKSVKKLKRIAVGPIELGDLESGKITKLDYNEQEKNYYLYRKPIINTNNDEISNFDNIMCLLKMEIIGDRYNEINMNMNIVDIIVKSSYNENIHELPNRVKNISFTIFFNSSVNKLPKTTKNIKFGYYFNRPVDNLPNSIKRIKFKSQFCQRVDHLPKNLREIHFGCNFNMLINNNFPGA